MARLLVAGSQAILHLSDIHRAIDDDTIKPLDGAERDVKHFFEKPVPKTVWREQLRFQDLDFIAFVESRCQQILESWCRLSATR